MWDNYNAKQEHWINNNLWPLIGQFTLVVNRHSVHSRPLWAEPSRAEPTAADKSRLSQRVTICNEELCSTGVSVYNAPAIRTPSSCRFTTISNCDVRLRWLHYTAPTVWIKEETENGVLEDHEPHKYSDWTESSCDVDVHCIDNSIYNCIVQLDSMRWFFHRRSWRTTQLFT